MYRFTQGALAGVLSVVFASTLSCGVASGQTPTVSASPQVLTSPSGSPLKVTLSSPWTNESVPGKVTFKATAQNGGVAFWALYDWGNLIWMDVTGNSSINIPVALTPGPHKFKVSAFDQSWTPSSVAGVPVNSTSSGQAMSWHACMYTENGQRMQAMKFTAHATMTGVLQSQMFNGSGCSATQWTDQLNDFGTSMTLYNGSSWIYYFIHRPNMPGVSAVWTFGNQTSGCVNYSTAPAC